MRSFIFIMLLIVNAFASKPVLDLDGILIYEAKEVLSYSNSNDTRKILLIFSTAKCPHCTNLKKQFYSLSPQTKKELSKRYIFALSEDDLSMLKTFNVTQTPTMFVLNQQKQFLIQPMQGEPVDINEVVSYLFEVSKM